MKNKLNGSGRNKLYLFVLINVQINVLVKLRKYLLMPEANGFTCT